jgi:hypothetical protein
LASLFYELDRLLIIKSPSVWDEEGLEAMGLKFGVVDDDVTTRNRVLTF